MYYPSLSGCLRKLASIAAGSRTILRDSRFSILTNDDVGFFRRLLGANSVVTDTNQLQSFNTDWTRRYTGHSKLALFPSNTEHVRAIMQYCTERRLAVVPQGGNTGLVGGGVPVFDEVIISLSKMDRVQSFDDLSGIIITQAGITLSQLDSYVAKKGFRAPIDIAPREHCQIGGTVATNAAGSRFVRYGSMRDSVVGLEAVTVEGRVIDALSAVRKDNTGYDLKQLFIGSEGTLGIITQVSIACPVRPTTTSSALLRVPAFRNVNQLLALARRVLTDVLSAFEFLDDYALLLSRDCMDTGLMDLCPSGPMSVDSGLVLVECAGLSTHHVLDSLQTFVDEAKRRGIATTGITASDADQASDMWKIREGLSEAVRNASTAASFKYDVSLPLHAYYACVLATRERLMKFDGVDVVAWGHVADGNLHLNIAVSNNQVVSLVQDTLEPWLYEFIAEHGGSISAEHGLGIMKADAIYYSKSPAAVDLMRVIKQSLDPSGICNPYKVLP